MGLFSHFPYTNFHELNLDWILGKQKENNARVDELEKDVNAIPDKIDDALEEKWPEAIAYIDRKVSDLYSRAKWIINVRDYDAKGDGVTDDSAAFQAAIDYARDKTSPGIIYIPSGVYQIGTTLEAYSLDGIAIVGARATTASPSSILRYTGTDYCIRMDHEDGQLGTYENVFANFAIKFTQACQGGFHIRTLQETLFLHVGVWADAINGVKNAFNIQSTELSQFDYCITSRTAIGFNFSDGNITSGDIYIDHCNIFHHAISINLGNSIAAVNIRDNWLEVFDIGIRISADTISKGSPRLNITGNTIRGAKVLPDGHTGSQPILIDKGTNYINYQNLSVRENIFTLIDGPGDNTSAIIVTAGVFLRGVISDNSVEGYPQGIISRTLTPQQLSYVTIERNIQTATTFNDISLEIPSNGIYKQGVTSALVAPDGTIVPVAENSVYQVVAYVKLSGETATLTAVCGGATLQFTESGVAGDVHKMDFDIVYKGGSVYLVHDNQSASAALAFTTPQGLAGFAISASGGEILTSRILAHTWS